MYTWHLMESFSGHKISDSLLIKSKLSRKTPLFNELLLSSCPLNANVVLAIVITCSIVSLHIRYREEPAVYVGYQVVYEHHHATVKFQS